MIKGPSLDAIKRFKEQQERKKREEDEKKVQEKLSTLEHRASQGDRKAKQELKFIERVKEERKKAPESQPKAKPEPSLFGKKLVDKSIGSVSINNNKRLKNQETDFEELMKLAKQNANEIRSLKPEEPRNQLPSVPKREKEKEIVKKLKPDIPTISSSNSRAKVVASGPKSSTSSSNMVIKVDHQQERLPTPQQQNRKAVELKKQQELQRRIELYKMRGSYGGQRHMNDYDDYEDDDEYESDGFVVDEEDVSVQDELRNTLRSVFNYDRRRCDRREEELDREYRAIGKVSTFEDLEREERRATRLAAEEDAREFRNEEERKRLKRLRLQKLQK